MTRVGILRAAYGAVLLGVIALAGLLLGPWGWELNRLTVRLYVFFGYDVAIAPGWALPWHYGALLNIVLFVPVGAALVLVTGWSWWRIGLFATAASVLVELTQATLVERVGSVMDVATNGLGAVLGAIAVNALGRIRPRPSS